MANISADASPAYLLLGVKGFIGQGGTSFDSICQELTDKVNTKIAEGYMPHGAQSVNVPTDTAAEYRSSIMQRQ